LLAAIALVAGCSNGDDRPAAPAGPVTTTPWTAPTVPPVGRPESAADEVTTTTTAVTAAGTGSGASTTTAPAAPSTTVSPVVSVVVGAGNTSHRCAPPVDLASTPVDTLRPSADVGSIADALADAGPGTRILLAPGDYAGELTIEVSGTAEAPIVLAPLSSNEARWVAGHITIEGSWVTVAGVDFTSTDRDLVRIVDRSVGVRLHGNRFVDAGSGDDGSMTGIVKVDPSPDWSQNPTAIDPPPVPVRRDLVIDANQFVRPRNPPIWVSHGNSHIQVCHNAIEGPHAIGGGETEAMKFGFGDGFYEDAESRVAFNTITDWEGRPYVIGVKMSGVDLIGNLITRGRVELRAANAMRVIGNVISDGDLQVGGRGHEITDNHVRTVTDRDGFGPFMMYATSGEPPYAQEPIWFYRAFADSLVARNTFHNATGSGGFAVVMGHAQFSTTGERPNGNVFVDNRFVSGTDGRIVIDNGHAADTAQLIGQNTWSGNESWWVGGIPADLPGTGNVSAAGLPDLLDVPTAISFVVP
jgi:hypothetical protein